MRPKILFEALAADAELTTLGITSSRIKELQSVDERPFDSGWFVILNMQEQDYQTVIDRGPRTLLAWVHTPWDRTRSYDKIGDILTRIDAIYRSLQHASGTDAIRLTTVRKTGSSGNLRDEGWKTLAQFHTYGVLYDEKAA
jgi:hypothetical protein